MTKLTQAFLSGLFITFILDFFLFLGIFENYIKPNEIDVYFNILFADSQSWILFILVSIAIGALTLYTKQKIALSLIGVLSLFSLLTLIAPIGKSIGEILLVQKGVTLQTNKFTYNGDILYAGRANITFYDYKLDRVLILQKTKLKGID